MKLSERSELVVVPGQGSLFEQVTGLGDSQRRYVGFFKRDVFVDYANKGHLIAIVDTASGALEAYVLFRATSERVTIAQLVVSPSARGNGHARTLVGELSRRYAACRGLRLKCRRNFPANTLWPKLGFVAIGDAPGRSKAGHHLTSWWRDHGHADLTTWDGASDGDNLAAMIDANVFFDLYGTAVNPTAGRTRNALRRVRGRLDVLVSPEMHNEIDRSGDKNNRKRLHSVVESYPHLGLDPGIVERWEREFAELGSTGRTQDASDLRHLAYAASSGVPIFITRDEKLRNRLGEFVLASRGLHIVSPGEVESLLDEIEDSEAYSPESLRRTGYSAGELRTDDEKDVIVLLSNGSGEKKNEFVQAARYVGSDGAHATRLVVRRNGGAVVGFVAASATDTELRVELLRTGSDPLSSTLAAQLVGELRRRATRTNRIIIRITDRHLSDQVKTVLVKHGFRSIGESVVGLAVEGLLSSGVVIDQVRGVPEEICELFSDVLLALGRVSDGVSKADEASAIERVLAPLVLEDSPLETFLVPIKSHFASPLLDYPPELFGREDELGISLEHIYYRSRRPAQEIAPSRLLWYISEGGPSGRAIVGTSQLIEVRNLPVRDAFRLNSRLGVYSYEQVVKQGDSDGIVRALRFVNTRLFAHPVTLRKIKQLAETHQTGMIYQSPFKLPPSMALDILREGLVL